MDVVVEAGNESMEVVSMILHCWFTNNQEGCMSLFPPFVHCLHSLKIGPFGVWPIMRGVVSVAVGAAILLAVRKCLCYRRQRTEAMRARDTTLNRADTPTRKNSSTRQLTIIPSPTKPATASTAAVRQTLTPPIEVAKIKIDFKTEAIDDGEEDSDSESGSTAGGDEDNDSVTDSEVTGHLLEVTPTHTPSPAHHNVFVEDQEVETSELTFNLTFTEESDSDTAFDEFDSHSITMTTPHSSSGNNTTADGILRQRMIANDEEHTLDYDDDDGTTEAVVSKAIITVI